MSVSTKLKSYTGDAIPALGSTPLQARYSNGKQVSVVAQVVGGDGPNLLGQDWLRLTCGTVQVNVILP